MSAERPPGAASSAGLARPVPSPCTSVCRMDDRSGWCEGCLRTIDEIAGWSTMSDEAKRQVWARLPARRAQRAAGGAP